MDVVIIEDDDDDCQILEPDEALKAKNAFFSARNLSWGEAVFDFVPPTVKHTVPEKDEVEVIEPPLNPPPSPRKDYFPEWGYMANIFDYVPPSFSKQAPSRNNYRRGSPSPSMMEMDISQQNGFDPSPPSSPSSPAPALFGDSATTEVKKSRVVKKPLSAILREKYSTPEYIPLGPTPKINNESDGAEDADNQTEAKANEATAAERLTKPATSKVKPKNRSGVPKQHKLRKNVIEEKQSMVPRKRKKERNKVNPRNEPRAKEPTHTGGISKTADLKQTNPGRKTRSSSQKMLTVPILAQNHSEKSTSKRTLKIKRRKIKKNAEAVEASQGKTPDELVTTTKTTESKEVSKSSHDTTHQKSVLKTTARKFNALGALIQLYSAESRTNHETETETIPVHTDSSKSHAEGPSETMHSKKKRKRRRLSEQEVYQVPPVEVGKIIGRNDVVVNSWLGKIKMECDYIPPECVKEEPVDDGEGKDETEVGPDSLETPLFGEVVSMGTLLTPKEEVDEFFEPIF